MLIEYKENNIKQIEINSQKFLENQQGQLDMLISIFNSKAYPNIDTFMGKNSFYLAMVGIFSDSIANLNRIWIKYGITARSIEREKEHLAKDFDKYELFYIKECDNANLLESTFEAKLKKLGIHRKRQFKTTQTELFVIIPEYNIETIILITDALVSKFNDKIDNKDQKIKDLEHKLEIISKEKESMLKSKENEIELLKKDQIIMTLKSKAKLLPNKPKKVPFK